MGQIKNKGLYYIEYPLINIAMLFYQIEPLKNGASPILPFNLQDS
jgi:hypothetical protein